MRRWTAMGWAAAVATVALQSASADDPKIKTPRIMLWERAGVWKTATPVTFQDFGFAFQDVEFKQEGSLVTGKFPGGTLAAVAPDGGDALLGFYHFDDGYVPDAKFIVRISDKKTYGVFKGKVQYPGKRGKPKWRPFVGKYASDPLTERGFPRLGVVLRAVKPDHHLTAANARPFVGDIRRAALPVKVAFTIQIRVHGKDEGGYMLPDGAADLVLTVGPNVGLTLPYSWTNQRTTSPGSYTAVGEAWEERVRLGALGMEKDVAFFALEAHVAPEFVGTGLHLKAEIKARNPNLQIEMDEHAQTEIDIPIVADPI